jgi:phosphatidylserine/phosphatidylglycerophosphate/cardiolipin synthase-like enzyme
MAKSESKTRKTTRSRSSSSKAKSRSPSRSRTSSRSRTRKSTTNRKKAPLLSVIGVLVALLLGYLAYEGYIELPEDFQLPEVGEIGELLEGGELPGLAEVTEEEEGVPPAEPAASRQTSTGTIEVFFTTPWLIYPDERDQRTPPPFLPKLLADLDAARSSIEVVTFDYNLESVADALIRAQERGVVVRLGLDHENLEKPEMSAWAGRLEEAGIPIAWEDTTAFQHSKFLIIDEALVWTGSWNISENGTYRNNNNLLRLTIPAIVENYAAEFSQMMGGEFGRGKLSLAPHPLIQVDALTIENYFSPQDGIEEHLVHHLSQAQERIRFLAFSYTSDPIAEAMLERHRAGVVVQGVFERRNAHGTGAEFERLQENGAEVLEDGNCYTMHHKVIIIDDETVITGSYNFSKRAEEDNDENVVIIQDPMIAGQFVEEFERVYAQSQNPIPCGR